MQIFYLFYKYTNRCAIMLHTFDTYLRYKLNFIMCNEYDDTQFERTEEEIL